MYSVKASLNRKHATRMSARGGRFGRQYIVQCASLLRRLSLLFLNIYKERLNPLLSAGMLRAQRDRRCLSTHNTQANTHQEQHTPKTHNCTPGTHHAARRFHHFGRTIKRTSRISAAAVPLHPQRLVGGDQLFKAASASPPPLHIVQPSKLPFLQRRSFPS